MSQENVELVRRVIAAYERGDFAAVFAAFAPDIEWRTARLGFGQLGIDPLYVGHEGVRTFWRDWLSAWETTSFEYEEFIDAGDHVVIVLSQKMRGRASGIEVALDSYANVWTARDGKLVGAEFFRTRADALEAVGIQQ